MGLRVVLLLMVVLFAVGIFGYARIIRILKQRHRQVWQQLGEPTLVLNNSVKNMRALNHFIRSNEIVGLGDDELSRWARVTRSLTRIYIVLFVAYLGLFVLEA